MLAVATAVEGSAGYLAMEQITWNAGRAQGHVRAPTYRHYDAPRAAQRTVVPDSGTDQLVGLSGRMDITIADGKHFYDFEYSLVPAP